MGRVLLATGLALLGLGCIDRSTVPGPGADLGALQWTEVVPLKPSARGGHAMATLGNKIVLFGGSASARGEGDGLDDTWQWDDRKWTKLAPARSPSARSGAAMATLGDQVVLFGGQGPGGWLADTWTWDGAAWTQVFPPTSPPARAYHAMATLGNKIVLYGGEELTPMGDTWEWDGTTWTERAMPGPPRRAAHAMATLGNKIVLFGGDNGAFNALPAAMDDTWEWDGATWTMHELDFQSRPPLSHGHAMAAAGDRVLLYGGVEPETPPDTHPKSWAWEWNGTTWRPLGAFCTGDGPGDLLCAPEGPRHRALAAMAGVNGKVVMFGGLMLGLFSKGPVATSNVATDDTWEWDHELWSRRLSSPGGGGAARLGDNVVLFGGLRVGGFSTWEWDGESWSSIGRSTSDPGHCLGCRLATRGTEIVRFGGDWDAAGVTRLATTWVWDGASWRMVDVPGPSGRDGHAMATMGDKVVLFGGNSSTGIPVALDDTWEWDGTSWTVRRLPVKPRARHGHEMAASGGRLVLFGGQDVDGFLLNDTWVWDGATWTELHPASSPPARLRFAMATVDQTAILFGGTTAGSLLHDTWAFTSAGWAQLTPLNFPTARADHVMASLAHGAILVGGGDNFDTWVLGQVTP